jgi:histone acetyltransferase (RNA polymerase elongator complex component)
MTDNSLKDFVIPVFIPHAGCPHQCVFCNQNTVTGEKKGIPSGKELNGVIDEFLKFKGAQRGKAQIAFYGGNFLGLEEAAVRELLSTAAKYVKNGLVESIRFSTRPDTIDEERLDITKDYPVSTIELGAQSMDDEVLAASRRGHTASDTEKAVSLIKKRNFTTGLQMMTGLPGDSEEKSLYTARRVAELDPDFVRIYPTVVLAESPLAVMYRRGKYIPLSLEEGVLIVKKAYLIFKEKNIRVIRMGLQATGDLQEGSSVVAGPYHPSFGHLVYSCVFLDKIADVLKKRPGLHDAISVSVHPKSLSEFRGLKNGNIVAIKRMFRIRSMWVVSDESIPPGEFALRE